MASFICLASINLVYYHGFTEISKTLTASEPTSLPTNPSLGSLIKLRKQLTPQQEQSFDRSRPIYIDFGLSDAKDTALYLSKNYSVVSVDAFLPWIEKAKEKFATEIAENRLWLFNVGLAMEEAEAMPLYFKEEGSVIASFVREKGCQGLPSTSEKCLHRDVPVIRCEAILQLLNAQAEIMKVDIEMLHHSCIRSLHRVKSALLPRNVCWEEHDKPFGSAAINRPITDVKLILGLFELGYNDIKLVLQGDRAHAFYQIDKSKAGHGQGSGSLSPEEMMHYRSFQDHEDGSFDTEWRPVHKVFEEGLFAQPHNKKFSSKAYRAMYFDICMKLPTPDNLDTVREQRQRPENFPLASYAS